MITLQRCISALESLFFAHCNTMNIARHYCLSTLRQTFANLLAEAGFKIVQPKISVCFIVFPKPVRARAHVQIELRFWAQLEFGRNDSRIELLCNVFLTFSAVCAQSCAHNCKLRQMFANSLKLLAAATSNLGLLCNQKCLCLIIVPNTMHRFELEQDNGL